MAVSPHHVSHATSRPMAPRRSRRLLHEDRRINLHESMPLIEPGTIAVTKEEGHAGPKGFRPSHGLDGHPAAQTLAAIGRRHEHSADADEWHGWSIADLNLAEKPIRP